MLDPSTGPIVGESRRARNRTVECRPSLPDHRRRPNMGNQ
jgi:hypothetical protein